MEPSVTVEVGQDGSVEAFTQVRELDHADVNIIPVAGLLHIEHPTGKEQSQLKDIYDFFAENAQGEGDLLYQIRQIENRMNPPRLGESRLSKLYNYVKLQRQSKQLEQELTSL